MTRAKVMGLRQLLDKKFIRMENLPEAVIDAFGNLTKAFAMIVWGASFNGKTNFLMQFLRAIMPSGKVLYISYEEGTEATMQDTAARHFEVEAHSGKIEFADHTMTLAELRKKLSKKKSPQFIVIDSLQYCGFKYADYKVLKEEFPKKAFIYISHAVGKRPACKTGGQIRYDAGVKVRVEGYIAFVGSRYGGTSNYVIWEEGAKKYWGKNYSKMLKNRLA